MSLHGGRFTAVKDLQLPRLTPPYISFLILFEGELDFALNQHRHHIRAEGGKILLIAAARESLFCRYLHQGQTTGKLTLKGLEHRLKHAPYRQHLAALYAEPVRSWPLDAHIAALAERCLTQTADENLAHALEREATVLQLLAALWQDYRRRYPATPSAENSSMPDDELTARLNHAFADDARHAAELARALHMSERTLQRRLRERFGCTPAKMRRDHHHRGG